MRIAEAYLAQQAQHVAAERRERKESLRVWVGDRPTDPAPNATNSSSQRPRRDSIDLSAHDHAGRAAPTDTSDDEADDASLPTELRLIKMMMERVFGIKIHMHGPPDSGQAEGERRAEALRTAVESATSERAGWGIEYDMQQTRIEMETTSFEAGGVIRTADGRELSFNLKLEMSRTYFEQTNVSLRAGDAQVKDPLVVNFGGTAAELSDTGFTFDINADGRTEQMPGLGAGRGFLALDRDGDGAISDGRELFGPATGNGFRELAAYDDDGNGWIDEADSVYSRLGVWTPGSRTALKSLGEAGVGAISLDSLSTPFTVKRPDGDVLGKVIASSVFLREDGQAGSVQQVDLAM